jgi:glyoxylase-like metal-dependent hydrolase (beta-lactamase superfamily II)
MKPEVTPFFHDDSNTFSYVVAPPEGEVAVIIDPVLDFDYKSARGSTETADRILQFVRDKGYRVAWILETHAHADHVSAAPYLAKELGAQIAIGRGIEEVQGRFTKIFNLPNEYQPRGSEFDRLLSDGDVIETGGMRIDVIHTPGHTSDSNSFLIGDAVFVGDTFFMPDAGSARADFPGGDAGMLYDSMQRLLSLPDQTRMFMCHDYGVGGREVLYETTVVEQRERNIHAGVDRGAYVQMREARDANLPMPRLIIPSVQLNMRAGKLPPAEDNGVSYLKVPLNLLGSEPQKAKQS